ncbi:aldehyde dehydrogenase [Pyrrhoderma noxium]|uniref:Aldehyde dehydrogenase n=1 Tax=Pyrrhoderma noxium TaxID=2282107 RepID=A0A286UHZ9_9AGAM|nr:aldehyde dehydrogenase [Pyrrhoderma noxium]
MPSTTVVPLWIDGKPRLSSDGGTFDVINPLNKEKASISASASLQDCKEAVEAAGRAFPTWEKHPAALKRDIFFKAVKLLQSEKYTLKIAEALRDETASIEQWTNINIVGSRNQLMEAASLATSIKGESFPSSSAIGGQVFVQRIPHGAVLAIAPWNAPISLSFRAIAIPLICGNTVVLKSSEYSPRAQEIVVEIMHEAGIPPGVLNYISMSRQDSPRLTAELIGNPIIRHINFTGSDRVGRIIAAEAAKYLKPCVFELGGKAPAVVLDDADTDAAARSIAQGALLHSGQICMSTERVIVQRNASETLIPKLKSLFERIRAGDTRLNAQSNNKVRLSALFSEASAENVLSMLDEAQKDGAELLVGDMKRDGAVVQPHLLKGVRPGMRIWERESFGPLVGISVVDTVDEAIELANATDYSLSAAVWTKDVNLALNVASRVRAGCKSVNGSTFHSEVGLGHAGLGGATGYGRFDIDNFTVKTMICIHPPQAAYPLVDDL